eukprot:6130380-Amphidinium_carterae.1
MASLTWGHPWVPVQSGRWTRSTHRPSPPGAHVWDGSGAAAALWPGWPHSGADSAATPPHSAWRHNLPT